MKPYDYSIATWGNGNLFQECKPYSKASTCAIKIHDDKYRTEIIKWLKWIYGYHNKTGILSQYAISATGITPQYIHQVISIGFPEIYKID